MYDSAKIAEQAARAAGAILMEWLGHVQIREKAPADLVTQADLASQQCIQRILAEHFPQDDFLGEEEGSDSGAINLAQLTHRTWIVDPLDGTTNFVHNLPAFCVSIALWDQAGARLAVVFDPYRNDLFRAERGCGAFQNGRRLQVSQCTRLGDALVAASFPPRMARDSPAVIQFLNVLTECRAVRRWGAAALNLAYVACGRFDAYWAGSVRPWDAAAGVLLVTEAGGCVTHLDGSPFQLHDPELLATATLPLHRDLHQCLHRVC